MSKAHTLAAFSQHLFFAGKCTGYYREKLHSNPGDRALPIIVMTMVIMIKVLKIVIKS